MENYPTKKEELTALFFQMSDFTVREFTLGNRQFCLFFLSNHSSKTLMHDFILEPLMRAYEECHTDFPPADRIAGTSVTRLSDVTEAKEAILSGFCVLLYTGMEEGWYGLSVSTRNEEGRSGTEPETETVIRGAHEGFTESAEQNAMLLRRRLKTEKLKKIDMTVGQVTKTAVSVMYLEDIVNRKILDELLRRLRGIDMDGILDSGYVELCIQDGRYAVYPTVGNSERPDKVAGKLLEGRIAVIVDGSPVVLTVPYLFCEAIQVAEDYSKSTYYATFVRLIRFLAMLIALYLPALFVALTVWHPDLLPPSFVESLTVSRENLPFSVFAEVLLIFGLFEIIREVGLRMPKAVGSAVGLVGSLILGDSAVDAGIASPTVMVFVALAAICNFIVPPYMNSNVLYRFLMIVISGAFGLFGFFLGLSVTLISLCAKRSFGVPYLYPLAPMDARGLCDYVLMLPVWRMRHGPSAITGKDVVRALGRRRKRES